ncbi:Retrotransposon Copia-like, N-terminal [Dillenia turbinata]|uniref:Retrotransposon Copia-like, N-terminal n=1 Tax=Dillenia turbinata TaxID=194707 RepID=A0AAN8V2T7_9MAGN
MGFKLLPIFVFLSLGPLAITSQAVLSPEAYWKKVLPNTPMPKAVTELLHNDLVQLADWTEEKRTSVDVGKGGVHVDTGIGNGGTTVNVGGDGVGVNTGKPVKRTNIGVSKGGVSVSSGHKRKLATRWSPLYNAATETQIHENQGVAIFFLEKDISQGTKMNLQFTRHEMEVGFLPRPITKSIPFSSDKLPEILNRFSVQPESEEAEIMKNTIKECEDPALKGEDKYCATSLESMVDYCTSKLGKSVEAISTEVDRQSQLQQYTITGVVKKAGDKAVTCHKEDYPYAVFYCHTTQTTKAYKVSLVGAGGTKANAIAICHTDTSEWNPKNLAFQLLKVKPGTLPICHFLPEDHIVWSLAAFSRQHSQGFRPLSSQSTEETPLFLPFPSSMANRKRSVTKNKVGLLGDDPSLQISPIKLDGTNYLSWSRLCLLFIQTRGLKGYVTGEKPKPAITDLTYNQWEAENSLVMSWFINSMQPHISKVSLTYSYVGNDAQIYELRNKVHETKQGEMTFDQYFAELSHLWQELDYYQDFQAICPEDATKFQKLVEKERIYDFLAGLNMEYDQIRVQKAGLVSKTIREQTKTGDSNTSDKDQLKCDYRGKPEHTKEGVESFMVDQIRAEKESIQGHQDHRQTYLKLLKHQRLARSPMEAFLMKRCKS